MIHKLLMNTCTILGDHTGKSTLAETSAAIGLYRILRFIFCEETGFRAFAKFIKITAGLCRIEADYAGLRILTEFRRRRGFI